MNKRKDRRLRDCALLIERERARSLSRRWPSSSFLVVAGNAGAFPLGRPLPVFRSMNSRLFHRYIYIYMCVCVQGSNSILGAKRRNVI